ncbi:glycosyltransferase family 9 protein [Flavobacterium enshiense]|uniref:ADP-heptose--LPS heptosyltransferase n=1 Tax=Flavobacterium enshiense DK69 TaxID=1107311 RepID=A0A0A2MNP0_9FLAO|nr:glycosyltransferase family 9 protein [Flavobacterium enshiense]KGO93949.1 hypothetical protein Q767_13455 [Flavobacterium enshiense DK69]
MSTSIEINKVRRRIMRSLTKNVGSSGVKLPFDADPLSVKRILVSRPNSRLGNLLLLSPLIQEINTVFPNAKVDLFVRSGLIPIIYKNYDAIGRDIRLPKKPFKELLKYLKVWISLRRYQYDLAVNVDKNSSSGRLSVKFSRSGYKFYGDEFDGGATPDEIWHMAKSPVYAFRSCLSNNILKKADAEVATMDLKLNSEELAIGKELVESVSGNSVPTIAIYTFATGNKCYSVSWWADFYSKLKEAFPEYNIVEVLPFENVSQIQFQAPHYYSRDIREMGAFISNTVVFITADCGIMHLASAVNTPTVGLFSVTNIEKYKPYNPGSMAFDTKKVSNDTIIENVKRLVEGLKKVN